MRSMPGFILILVVLAVLVLASLLSRTAQRSVVEPEPVAASANIDEQTDGSAPGDPVTMPDDGWSTLVEDEPRPEYSPEGLYRDLDETFSSIPGVDDAQQDRTMDLDTRLPELPPPKNDPDH